MESIELALARNYQRREDRRRWKEEELKQEAKYEAWRLEDRNRWLEAMPAGQRWVFDTVTSVCCACDVKDESDERTRSFLLTKENPDTRYWNATYQVHLLLKKWFLSSWHHLLPAIVTAHILPYLGKNEYWKAPTLCIAVQCNPVTGADDQLVSELKVGNYLYVDRKEGYGKEWRCQRCAVVYRPCWICDSQAEWYQRDPQRFKDPPAIGMQCSRNDIWMANHGHFIGSCRDVCTNRQCSSRNG